MLANVDVNDIRARFETLWSEGTEIWIAGGWAMIAIAVIAFAMFMIGVRVWFRLRAKGIHRVNETTWRRWLDDEKARRGPVGALVDFVLEPQDLEHLETRFEQVRSHDMVSVERDLRVMKICVSAAPLVGLLGTVTGMLSTFSALASGSGGEKTLGLVAGGISEALITTETGLVIALPGVFFHFHLVRRSERYKAFLAHLESVCAQRLHRASITNDAPRPVMPSVPDVEVIPANAMPALIDAHDI